MEKTIKEYYDYYNNLSEAEREGYNNFAHWLADECRGNAVAYADLIGDDKCDDIDGRIADLIYNLCHK